MGNRCMTTWVNCNAAAWGNQLMAECMATTVCEADTHQLSGAVDQGLLKSDIEGLFTGQRPIMI